MFDNVQYVQSRIGYVSTERLHKLLPSELTKTTVHSTTPIALNEDRKPGNTNEVLPASRVQQYFFRAALHGHERS